MLVLYHLKYQIINKDKKTVNPLDISQWEFFVLPTKVLDQREQSQHSITLSSLNKITKSVSFNYDLPLRMLHHNHPFNQLKLGLFLIDLSLRFLLNPKRRFENENKG